MSDPDITAVSKGIDLIYSTDDDGWYFQRYPLGETSQLFVDRRQAMDAYKNDQLEWEV